MIKFTFLSENKTDDPACDAEFGLSVYIETPAMNILFDTGASDLFEKNARRKHVDLVWPQAAMKNGMSSCLP